MFDHCVSDKVRVDILPLCHKCQHALTLFAKLMSILENRPTAGQPQGLRLQKPILVQLVKCQQNLIRYSVISVFASFR